MKFPQGKNKRAGFSLVELLVVIGIIALLTAAGGPALSALTASGGANQNISQLSGILEQAREYAVAQNTYVWVAFYAHPDTAGYNDVSVAVVASTDGTDPGVFSALALPVGSGTNLALINKVVTMKQVYVEKATGVTLTLPSTPSDPANSVASSNGGFFKIQIPGSSTTSAFTQVIGFTPSGQAVNSGSPIDIIDVDLQLQKGNSTTFDPTKVAVLRVNGLTGETTVYRP